jgi:hypothetical protein
VDRQSAPASAALASVAPASRVEDDELLLVDALLLVDVAADPSGKITVMGPGKGFIGTV